MVENNMTTKNITTNSNITFFNKSNLFEAIHNRVKSKDKGSTVMIPHICNNVGLFGGGFTAGISKYFPIVKENFYMLGTKTKLGHVQFVSAYKDKEYGHEIIFANMIAQNNTKSLNNPRPLNYIALAYCLNQVRQYASEYKRNNDLHDIELHCPKFGSGLAGGDWKFILQMIEDCWVDMKNIFIYSL